MSWKLTGRYVENCSCTAICPCTWSGLAVPATTERCYGALTYHIDDGEIEGVDVSGLHVAVLTDSPALMLKGNWRVALVIDAKASDEQANKLEKVFWGDLGGPASWLRPLTSIPGGRCEVCPRAAVRSSAGVSAGGRGCLSCVRG